MGRDCRRGRGAEEADNQVARKMLAGFTRWQHVRSGWQAHLLEQLFFGHRLGLQILVDLEGQGDLRQVGGQGAKR